MARGLRTALLMAAALSMAGSAWADAHEGDEIRARDDRIEDLERKLEIVTEELADLRTQVAVPTETTMESQYGFAPAASKIYGVSQGLSVGGYAEAFYRNFVNDDGGGRDKEINDSDFLRMVLYFGYKFTDNIVFNSEIEIEHGTTSSTPNSSGGSVSVEFAALDFFWKEQLNFRAGMLLLPMGFINEVHEPPTFFGVQRPLTERTIIPTTWRENGAGIFGQIGETFEYRSYVVNGFDATGFSSSGIRGGRQKGNRTLANDLAWVTRVDWSPMPGALFGGSFYLGKSGQDQPADGQLVPDSLLALWELHAEYERGPFRGRALFAMSHLDDAGELNRVLGNSSGSAIARRMFGGYVEAGYDVFPLLFGETEKYLAPFFRVERVNPQDELPSDFAQDKTENLWLFTTGFNYKPHPNVVLKFEYRNFQQRETDRADEVSLGMGLSF